MNKLSKEELMAFSTYVESNTDFSAYARLLQAKWREKMSYPIGKSNRGTIYGNYVEMKFARENCCNFLTNKIWDVAKNEIIKAKREGYQFNFAEDRFFSNLFKIPPV